MDTSNSAHQQADKPKEDLTGRDRLVSNVLFSWAAHFVFIVAGFIMPRMIDRRLGQEVLGVWDFAWSLVSYFGLVQAGVGSGVNRYVARYRAAGDTSGLNRLVSSASSILSLAGLLVLALTIAGSLLLPRLFGARLGHNALDAQWVVLFLGASLALEMALAAFSGVLTGCHRWELHNIIKGGWYAATVAGMIVALLSGAGLRSLAVITFAGTALDATTHVVLAHRVCEGLRLQLSLVGWETIKQLFVFGGKTLIPSVSNLLLNQTTSILIVAYLGPAALALYSRPRSLIHHINTLVNKMAFVLIPTTSSLQSMGNVKEIRDLLITSVRYSLYLVLPMVLVLVVFGESVMRPRSAAGSCAAMRSRALAMRDSSSGCVANQASSAPGSLWRSLSRISNIPGMPFGSIPARMRYVTATASASSSSWRLKRANTAFAPSPMAASPAWLLQTLVSTQTATIPILAPCAFCICCTE